MKEIKSNKKNPLIKIFIKICRLFGFEIIDQSNFSIPTSGTLPRGSYTLETLLTKNGGFVPRLMIGLSDNFSLGMSFGVRNFIGEDKPEKNKATPEVQLKYRIFEETESSPAFLIGLDTQGFGPFIQNAEYSKFIVIGKVSSTSIVCE